MELERSDGSPGGERRSRRRRMGAEGDEQSSTGTNKEGASPMDRNE